MVEHILELCCMHVFRRIVVSHQSLEMRLATSDLRCFLITEIVGKQAGLRFNNEIQALPPVDLKQHGPIGIVGSEGCRNFEPAGKFRIDLDGVVLFICSAKVRSTPAESRMTCS